MIDLELLQKNIKSKKYNNCYIFCGLDEMLMKENITYMTKQFVDEAFGDLNVIKFDGNNLKYEDFMNACETLPFMSEKKVVIIYRIPFLKEKLDSENQKLYTQCVEYFKNPPEHCIILSYVLLKDKREKANRLKKLMSLDKSTTIVSVDKLKGDKLYKRVEDIFNKNGREIGRIQLKYFCDLVENNLDIIEREVDKLVNYAKGREITKEDIDLLLPAKSEQDIFDLVEFISIKKPDKAIDLMNELLHRGENVMVILSQIREQFQKLYRVKVRLQQGYSVDNIKSEFLTVNKINLPNFIIEKFITQSKKFNEKQLAKCIKLCVETEKKLKSSGIDSKTEMELMIISTVI